MDCELFESLSGEIEDNCRLIRIWSISKRPDLTCDSSGFIWSPLHCAEMFMSAWDDPDQIPFFHFPASRRSEPNDLHMILPKASLQHHKPREHMIRK
jgi:hypothetical protein